MARYRLFRRPEDSLEIPVNNKMRPLQGLVDLKSQ